MNSLKFQRFEAEANIRFQEEAIPFIINYTFGFARGNFTYFIMNQNEYLPRDDEKDVINVAKMGRVCQQNEELDSYSEIVLICLANNNDEYSVPQSASVGAPSTELADSLNISKTDEVLFVIFAKNYEDTTRSVLCMYSMRDVEKHFLDAIFGCLSNGDNFKLNYANGSRCTNSSVSILYSVQT